MVIQARNETQEYFPNQTLKTRVSILCTQKSQALLNAMLTSKARAGFSKNIGEWAAEKELGETQGLILKVLGVEREDIFGKKEKNSHLYSTSAWSSSVDKNPCVAQLVSLLNPLPSPLVHILVESSSRKEFSQVSLGRTTPSG